MEQFGNEKDDVISIHSEVLLEPSAFAHRYRLWTIALHFWASTGPLLFPEVEQS